MSESEEVIKGADQEAVSSSNFLKQLLDEKLPDDAHQKIRQKSLEQFLAYGLPSRKNDLFHGIKLRKLFTESYPISLLKTLSKEEIAPYVLPVSQESFVVCINGRFCPDLSNFKALPSRINILSLEEGTQTYGTFLSNHWIKSLKDENDPFALINSALHQKGFFLYIPPKTTLDTPIQILHFSVDEGRSAMHLPRGHMFIGAGSSINLIHSYPHTAYSKTSYFVNQATEIAIENDSCVHNTQLINDEHPLSWHFNTLKVHLKQGSSFHNYCFNRGSAGVRTSYKITLAGEKGEASINSLSLLSEKREAYSHVLMDHQAPHCTSSQHFKSVLDDFSRFSFSGKIFVQQAAQKTEAFQLNNNLLLSDGAHADTRPNLEIFADDVKASHGATIGGVDNNQLFYLKTRGVPEKTAQKLVVRGFCAKILEKVKELSGFDFSF